MTVHYLTTSIFDSPAVNLVNPVNCVGVMGAGLAREFKNRFPQMFEAYKADCDAGLLTTGVVRPYWGMEKNIICVATKDDWREPSRLGWVDLCLVGLANMAPIWGSIALPQLGCGHGGLRWPDVRPLVEDRLATLPQQFYVHLVQS